MERFHPKHIKFAFEQDGETERELKDRLSARFAAMPELNQAYLVRVQMDNSPELRVALCLQTTNGIDDMKAVKAAESEFEKVFRASESLDILFLTPAQVREISSVAQPFYTRASKDPP
jgi:hypothetical protein